MIPFAPSGADQFGVEMTGENEYLLLLIFVQFILVDPMQVKVDDGVVDEFVFLQGSVIVEA